MRLETFSYLPALSDEEIEAQIRSILARRLVVAIEHTEEPDAYDHYWTLWKLPLFDVHRPETVVAELEECRRANPNAYEPILKPVYRHSDGTFGPPVYLPPARFVVTEGLLAFHTPELRNMFDVRVYLHPPEELRRRWKVARDCSRLHDRRGARRARPARA